MYAIDLMLDWGEDGDGKRPMVPQLLEFNWLPDFSIMSSLFFGLERQKDQMITVTSCLLWQVCMYSVFSMENAVIVINDDNNDDLPLILILMI